MKKATIEKIERYSIINCNKCFTFFNRGPLLLTWSRLEIGPDDIMATAKSKLVSEDDKAAMLHSFFAM